MVAVTGEPSGAQSLPSDGDEEPHLSPSNPQPGGRTPQLLQANLVDLVDNEFWQLMEELHREIALCELNVPPRSPPQTPWGNPMGILMQMTRRSPFWEGRVGSPRATISSSCPYTTRWRVEPRGQPHCPQGGQPSHPQHLFNLRRVWGA